MATRSQPPSPPPSSSEPARRVTGGAFTAAIARGDNRTAWTTAKSQLATPDAPHEAAREALNRIGFDSVAVLVGGCILAIQIVAMTLMYFG